MSSNTSPDGTKSGPGRARKRSSRGKNQLASWRGYATVDHSANQFGLLSSSAIQTARGAPVEASSPILPKGGAANRGHPPTPSLPSLCSDEDRMKSDPLKIPRAGDLGASLYTSSIIPNVQLPLQSRAPQACDSPVSTKDLPPVRQHRFSLDEYLPSDGAVATGRQGKSGATADVAAPLAGLVQEAEALLSRHWDQLHMGIGTATDNQCANGGPRAPPCRSSSPQLQCGRNSREDPATAADDEVPANCIREPDSRKQRSRQIVRPQEGFPVSDDPSVRSLPSHGDSTSSMPGLAGPRSVSSPVERKPLKPRREQGARTGSPLVVDDRVTTATLRQLIYHTPPSHFIDSLHTELDTRPRSAAQDGDRRQSICTKGAAVAPADSLLSNTCHADVTYLETLRSVVSRREPPLLHVARKSKQVDKAEPRHRAAAAEGLTPVPAGLPPTSLPTASSRYGFQEQQKKASGLPHVVVHRMEMERDAALRVSQLREEAHTRTVRGVSFGLNSEGDSWLTQQLVQQLLLEVKAEEMSRRQQNTHTAQQVTPTDTEMRRPATSLLLSALATSGAFADHAGQLLGGSTADVAAAARSIRIPSRSEALQALQDEEGITHIPPLFWVYTSREGKLVRHPRGSTLSGALDPLVAAGEPGSTQYNIQSWEKVLVPPETQAALLYPPSRSRGNRSEVLLLASVMDHMLTTPLTAGYDSAEHGNRSMKLSALDVLQRADLAYATSRAPTPRSAVDDASASDTSRMQSSQQRSGRTFITDVDEGPGANTSVAARGGTSYNGKQQVLANESSTPLHSNHLLYHQAIWQLTKVLDCGLHEIAKQTVPLCVERAALLHSIRQMWHDAQLTMLDVLLHSKETAAKAVAERDAAQRALSASKRDLEEGRKKYAALEREMQELREKMEGLEAVAKRLRTAQRRSRLRENTWAGHDGAVHAELAEEMRQRSAEGAFEGMEILYRIEAEHKGLSAATAREHAEDRLKRMQREQKEEGDALLLKESIKMVESLSNLVSATNKACAPLYDRVASFHPALQARLVKGRWAAIAKAVGEHKKELRRRQRIFDLFTVWTERHRDRLRLLERTAAVSAAQRGLEEHRTSPAPAAAGLHSDEAHALRQNNPSPVASESVGSLSYAEARESRLAPIPRITQQELDFLLITRPASAEQVSDDGSWEQPSESGAAVSASLRCTVEELNALMEEDFDFRAYLHPPLVIPPSEPLSAMDVAELLQSTHVTFSEIAERLLAISASGVVHEGMKPSLQPPERPEDKCMLCGRISKIELAKRRQRQVLEKIATEVQKRVDDLMTRMNDVVGEKAKLAGQLHAMENAYTTSQQDRLELLEMIDALQRNGADGVSE